jgi:hypothetical protein
MFAMDDLRAYVMQMLAGHAGGDISSQIREALIARVNQRPPGDPLREVLAQMLAKPRPETPKPEPEPRDLLRAARDALNAMQARNVVIAAALGACSECLGEEPECLTCSGVGRPGWKAPDPVAFQTWVAPALKAMARAGQSVKTDRRPPSSPEKPLPERRIIAKEEVNHESL